VLIKTAVIFFAGTRLKTQMPDKYTGGISSLLVILKERMLFLTVVLSGLLPVTILPAVESLDILKPLRLLAVSILEEHLEIHVSKIGMISLRVAFAGLALVLVIETTRIIPYLLHFFVLTNKLWLSNISCANLVFMENIRNVEGLRHLHNCYMRLTILQSYVRIFADTEGFFLCYILSKLIPLLLFLCIRMYDIFPIEIYIPVCLGTPIALAICILLTRFTCDINEESKANIQMWRNKINRSKNKELYRMYGYLKPLGFSLGLNGFVVGYLDMDCMKEIMLDIQNTTVDLLILFPAAKFVF